MSAPLGKGDHEVLEMTTQEGEQRQDELYRKKRRNYIKADYDGLRNFFTDTDWTDLKNCNNKQYDIFLTI